MQLGEPEFYTEDEATIAAKLTVSDPELAIMLDAEAVGVYDAQLASAASIESRATTLQGTVGIAVTLALAAAGLLLDPSKIPSHWWQLSFALILVVAVASFIASGLRAVQASSQTFPWAVPGFGDIFEHAGMTSAAARAAHATAHLRSAGRNVRIVQIKAGYLNAAVFWFMIALLCLATLAVVLLVYVATARHGVAQIRLRGHRHH